MHRPVPTGILRTTPGGLSLLLVVALVMMAGTGVHGARRAALVGAGLAAMVAGVAEDEAERGALGSGLARRERLATPGIVRACEGVLDGCGAREMARLGLTDLPPPPRA
jgi:hypothetical protein